MMQAVRYYYESMISHKYKKNMTENYRSIDTSTERCLRTRGLSVLAVKLIEWTQEFGEHSTALIESTDYLQVG